MPLLVVYGHSDSIDLVNVSIYDVIAVFAMRVVVHFGFCRSGSVGIVIDLELLSTVSLDLVSVKLVVSDLAKVPWVAWRLRHILLTIYDLVAIFEIFEEACVSNRRWINNSRGIFHRLVVIVLGVRLNFGTHRSMNNSSSFLSEG